jgi:hypothetical protein
MVDLCFAELAISTLERMVLGGRRVEILRMKITGGGDKAGWTGGGVSRIV